MIQARRVTALLIRLQVDLFALPEVTGLHFADVHGEVGARLLRIEDLDRRAARGLDRAAVTDLAAGLAVERRLRNDDLHLVAGLRVVALGAVDDQCRHLALPVVDAIANELRSEASRRSDDLGTALARIATA